MDETMKKLLKKEIAEVNKLLIKNREKKTGRKALFLDFDGVIHVFYEPGSEGYEKALKRMENNRFSFADPDCIAHLDELIELYNLDIIVSSSWRFNGLNYCRKYLKKAGLRHADRVQWITQTETFMDRRLEILSFLKEHPVYEQYVVLDDIEMFELGSSYIQINPTKGFDQEREEEAKRVLGLY